MMNPFIRCLPLRQLMVLTRCSGFVASQAIHPGVRWNPRCKRPSCLPLIYVDSLDGRFERLETRDDVIHAVFEIGALGEFVHHPRERNAGEAAVGVASADGTMNARKPDLFQLCSVVVAFQFPEIRRE